MARLIDADALIDKIERARKKAKTLTGMDFVLVTKDQPTIDAIPVKWLQKYTVVGVTPRGDRLTEGKERLIVQRIMNDWQKEQEAR